MTKDRTGANPTKAIEFPPEVSLLLEKIENEPVPERLLALARTLQTALAARRSRDASTSAAEAAERVAE